MIMEYILNVKVSDLEQINRVLDEISHTIIKILGIVVFTLMIFGVIYVFYYMIVMGKIVSML